MYEVTVYRNGEAVDSRDFDFGTWEEIGFWLDWHGFNDAKYEVKINFREVGPC